MTETQHKELLLALAKQVPRFALSVACIDPQAGVIEPLVRAGGASFTSYAQGVALSPGLHDCYLIGMEAEAYLRNDPYIGDILAHLSSNGMLISLLPSRYADGLSTELEATLEAAGLVLLRILPVNENWPGFVFARASYDPINHARQLGDAGMPVRAIRVLDWMEHYTPLKPRARATVALKKLNYYRAAVEHVDTQNHSMLFHAQKEFHIAVHEWPKSARACIDQAAIWRGYGNDDYAARLLRSLHHVTLDVAVAEALAQCTPERTPQPPVETSPEWTGNKRAPRVLVLTHDYSDYGMDTLYDGLCQVLGKDNVVEWPWKPTLHGRDKDAAVNYPCWFEYPGEPQSVDDLVQDLCDGRFDLIVFADFVQMNKQDHILRMLNAAPDVPVVVYDPWDDGSATQDSAREYLGGRPIAAYFKREMLACLDYGPNAYPLPFGYPDRHVPTALPERRDTDLFWAGKRLFGTRTLYLDRLNEVLGRTLDQKLSQEEYRRAIATARMGLSFFGFGFDTVRYWELAAHGCMILAERPCIRIPFNFVEGESAVFFDDLPELEEKLAYYLAQDDEAERIGRAGREHFLKYHTTSARARQFLGRVEYLI
ncbi:MAG: glycosyltransferase family 1 protein [Candidatus Hydrogenedentes bacterium]|nr:glycosyltransferase family 1 protein [Candidatus Hydrogenedentota bacterium]